MVAFQRAQVPDDLFQEPTVEALLAGEQGRADLYNEPFSSCKLLFQSPIPALFRMVFHFDVAYEHGFTLMGAESC